MPFIRLADNFYPLTEQEIRQAHPNVSFAQPFAPTGYAVVFPQPQPGHNPIIELVRETFPTLRGDGTYIQTWEVVSMFSLYTDGEGVIHTVAEQEAAALAADAMAKAGRLRESVVTATQARLDAFAQTRNYDGILSACTYATSVIPKFQTEGQYCVGARDATWAALYQILAAVQAGTRTMPTGYADIEPDLPVLTWPV